MYNPDVLLPCPFCGSQAVITRDSYGVSITCEDPSDSCTAEQVGHDEQEALRLWNQRWMPPEWEKVR